MQHEIKRTCSRCSCGLKSIHYCPNCEEDPRERIRRLEDALRNIREAAGEVLTAIYMHKNLGACTECVTKLHMADIEARAFERMPV